MTTFSNDPSAAIGDIDQAKADLRAILSGVVSGRLADRHWDFVAGESDFVKATGTNASTSGRYPGGVRVQATTAAGADSNVYFSQDTVLGRNSSVPNSNPKANKWAVSARWKFSGTVEAATVAMVGLGEGASPGGIGIGVFGDGSTTKYCLVQNGGASVKTALSTDISIDTAFHQFDLVFDGTNFRTRIDRGLWVLTAKDAGMFDDYLYIQREVLNGATASVRTLETDWIVWVADGG